MNILKKFVYKLMNYLNKYLKYKNKYSILKNQSGGNNDFYLPCDITHFTDKVYYSDHMTRILQPSIGVSSTGFGEFKYYQDPYVQLYNDKLNCYYNLFTSFTTNLYSSTSARKCDSEQCVFSFTNAIKIIQILKALNMYTLNTLCNEPTLFDILSFSNIKFTDEELKTYGDTKIDAFDINTSDDFYSKLQRIRENINTLSLNNLESLIKLNRLDINNVLYMGQPIMKKDIYTKNDIIPLHIIGSTYKLTQGTARLKSIIDKTKLKNEYPTFLNDINKQIHFNVENKSYMEQCKGGNFISAPNGTIFCISGANEKFIDKLTEISKYKVIQLHCGFKSNMFRHIDELMCFMPYGNGKYKVWYYNELNTESFQLLFRIFNTLGYNICEDILIRGDALIQYITSNPNLFNIDEIIKELNKERLTNLEIISKELFNDAFDSCKDNFVFFDYYSYKPSIFNRTWYETNEKVVCLFPMVITTNNKQILNNEILNVKSYINETKPITYKYVEVNPANEFHPEGTVHCLIKQRFIKPK